MSKEIKKYWGQEECLSYLKAFFAESGCTKINTDVCLDEATVTFYFRKLELEKVAYKMCGLREQLTIDNIGHIDYNSNKNQS